MRNVLKRFFPILTCVLLLVVSIVPVSAADYVDDSSDANFFYSVWPLDDISFYGPVDTTWMVNAPYPGGVRLNPNQFASISSGFYTSQYTFAVGATRSRVNYIYSGVIESPGRPFGSYQCNYDLSNANSPVPVTPIWSRIELNGSQTIVPASLLQQMAMPRLRLAWTSTVAGNFEPEDCVNVTLRCLVSWYTEIESENNTEYYPDYVEVNQTASYYPSMAGGLEMPIYYLLESIPAVNALDPNTKISIEDFQLTVDWSDLSDENVFCTIEDFISTAQYTAVNFMPWTNDRPVQPMDFWSWISPALSGALESPILYGWSISDMLSVIFIILFTIILLKFFAGG